MRGREVELPTGQQILDSQTEVTGNNLDDFGMQRLAFMVGNRDANPLRITEDFMASRLSDLSETTALDQPDGLIGSQRRNTLTHTASSSVATLMDSRAGNDWWVVLRSSRWSRMASFIWATASSYVSPWV